MDLIIEARKRSDGVTPSLIDLEAYNEMLELHSFIINNITVEPPEDYAKKRVSQGMPA